MMRSDPRRHGPLRTAGRWNWLVLGVLPCLALISAGVFARLSLQDVPNFAPVAALALYAGYAFRYASLAALVPLGIMGISDQFVGGYDLRIMLIVYACLTLPVLARGPLRRWVTWGTPERTRWVTPLVTLIGSSLAASVLFFVVTNFAVWAAGDWYPQSWSGLVQCYGQALPFFRNTLLGDLFFASLLFAGHALALHQGWMAWPVRRSQLVRVEQV